MIVALALLAPAAPPPPHHLVPVFSADDYPRAALDRGEEGSVYWQVIINPEGLVDSCKVLISSGHRDLDDATCRLVASRARFSPATDDRDQPIYGTYRSVTSWRINSVGPPVVVAPDVELTINQAPEGAKLPLQLKVSYLIKANGKASRCLLATDSKPAPQVLVDLACKAVLESPVQIVRDHNNAAVDASDSATVRFSVKR